jgi:hypothetical protein
VHIESALNLFERFVQILIAGHKTPVTGFANAAQWKRNSYQPEGSLGHVQSLAGVQVNIRIDGFCWFLQARAVSHSSYSGSRPVDFKLHHYPVLGSGSISPAMEAGLVNHPWTIEELVGLLEQRESREAA